jgi:hypothetical protein
MISSGSRLNIARTGVLYLKRKDSRRMYGPMSFLVALGLGWRISSRRLVSNDNDLALVI